MLSYACAPMPFVLGLLHAHLPLLAREPTEALLLVHLESSKLESADAEVLAAANLPRTLAAPLAAALVKLTGCAYPRQRTFRSKRLDDQAVSQLVLQGALLRLLGGYRRHVRREAAEGAPPRPGELHAAFDEKAFLLSALADHRPFIVAMRGSQCFAHFVN